MEKMMMPAYYNVLSTEEMTYTEGGATATMSEALLCWLIPPYGWFKGVTAVRDYRRKNPNTWMVRHFNRFWCRSGHQRSDHPALIHLIIS